MGEPNNPNHWSTPENAPAIPFAVVPAEDLPDPGREGGILKAGQAVAWAGLTAREHAAIQLRLPDSGNPWLDEMIAKARVLDTAVALLAASNPVDAMLGVSEDHVLAHEKAFALLDEVLTEPRII